MKEMLFVFGIMLIIGIFFFVVIFATDRLAGWYYTNKDNKRRQEHPELYQLFDLVDEKGGECCRWYNENISPKKRLVDTMLKEIPYLPEEKRIEAEKEIEKVRQEIYVATITDKVLEDELRELREQVRDYIDKHDVKWAKDWGW